MNKKWRIVISGVLFTAGIVGILYVSQKELMELSSPDDEISENLSLMDMSDISSGSVSCSSSDVDHADIYDGKKEPSRENIDLGSCRLSDTSPMIKYIEKLRTVTNEGDKSSIESYIEWRKVPLSEREAAKDRLEHFCELLSSDAEWYLIGETETKDGDLARITFLHSLQGVALDRMYDYANAETIEITVFKGVDGKYRFVPYSLF